MATAEVISWFWKILSVASTLQCGTSYVLLLLNIIHVDPGNLICSWKCYNIWYQLLKSIQCRYGIYLLSKQTYVGKPVFRCTVFHLLKNKPDNFEMYCKKTKLFIYQKLQGLRPLQADSII
jgi:hypothetical protein